MAIANLGAALLCYGMYRVERRRLTPKLAFALIFLVLLFASLVNQMHKIVVDYGLPHSHVSTNVEWQVTIQNATIRMQRDALPHSYRFLPNALVRWLEVGGFTYEAGRNVYRMYFGLLTFYALYRFARLYTTYVGAIIAMALTAAIYPVSFAHYSGQLTDPLSHLSFLLCFIFLEIEDFSFFLAVMLIGSLTKETVLALSGYYALFARKEPRHLWKALLAGVGAAAAYLSVRLLVLNGAIRYRNVSGVGLEHIARNWHENDWRALFLLTGGALLPFLVLGWRRTPTALKRLVLYLLPVIFVSSLFFSWLVETRNFMPVVFILSVVAGNMLAEEFGPVDRMSKVTS